jgi:hypothetical protein
MQKRQRHYKNKSLGKRTKNMHLSVASIALHFL